jgi:hypothetical protein
MRMYLSSLADAELQPVKNNRPSNPVAGYSFDPHISQLQNSYFPTAKLQWGSGARCC